MHCLPGASVVVKGTSQGTVTDIKGAFSLQVPNENATLEFSFVGYATQVMIVGSQRIINITLKEDSREIEKVVVIGYGSVKRGSLTSAVSKMDAQALAPCLASKTPYRVSLSA